MNAKRQSESDHKSSSFWKELPILLVIALVLAFVIRTWIAQPFSIPSGSMEDTLQVGDRVLVNKLVYQVRDIQRGDVLVFNGADSWDAHTITDAPEPTSPVGGLVSWAGEALALTTEGRDYIKRVIGLPGDTVECCDEQNRILVNGVPVDEPYLFPDSLATHQEFGPITVEEGWLWVLGDHRSLSYDSRTHQNSPGGGSVSIDSVIGHASVVVWPVSRVSTLSDNGAFSQVDTQVDAEPQDEADSEAPPEAATAAGVLALPLALGLTGLATLGRLPWHRFRRPGRR